MSNDKSALVSFLLPCQLEIGTILIYSREVTKIEHKLLNCILKFYDVHTDRVEYKNKSKIVSSRITVSSILMPDLWQVTQVEGSF